MFHDLAKLHAQLNITPFFYPEYRGKLDTFSGPRGATPIFGHGRDVPRWCPPFLGLSIWLSPNFIPQHSPIDPLFLQKKSVCLYHI